MQDGLALAWQQEGRNKQGCCWIIKVTLTERGERRRRLGLGGAGQEPQEGIGNPQLFWILHTEIPRVKHSHETPMTAGPCRPPVVGLEMVGSQ